MKIYILVLSLMLPLTIFAQDDSKKVFYNTFDLSFHFGQSDRSPSQDARYTKGFGLKYSMGYHWKSWMSFGAGLGVDMYGLDGVNTENYPFVPLFVEMKGKMEDKKIAPYYELGLGYAFFFTKTSPWNSYHENGGVYFRPTIGLQFEPYNDFLMSIYIGYQLQQQVNRRDEDSTDLDPLENELYQRTVMGIKLGF